MTSFNELGLSEPMVRAVVAAGYTTPTPIQAAAIPAALAGRDLTGCAQTGTGKTAAFVLPMLERLSASGHSQARSVRALVVTPTRELALQVAESAKAYGRFTGLRATAIFGGVSMEPQLKALRRGVDIVVATPGRLLDHLARRSLDLSRVEILVLDEADRMFDMGFINDVRKIVAAVPRQRQTLLFSATMPPAIQSLAASIQHRPEFVEVGQRRNPAETVQQRFYSVSQEMKLDLLMHVLDTEQGSSVLVFSRTKHRADRITRRLAKRGISAAAIHSNRTQNQRQRALDGFKRGEYRVLVGTDVAARGIDVDGISHVINFDTPGQAEDYIHRIGRTGRASATGEALTFVSHDEVANLREIERHTGQRFERGAYPGFRDAGASGDGRGREIPEVRVADARPSGQADRRSSGGGRGRSSRRGRR